MEHASEIQSRIHGLEIRVRDIEDEVAKLNSNLLGTYEKPGTLELVRRTNETVNDVGNKIDLLTESVDTLKFHRAHVVGWISGIGAFGVVIGWLIRVFVKQ